MVKKTKIPDDLEKIANTLVYNVIRRILECARYRSASGLCSPSSPSPLCSLSEDSVNNSITQPLTRNSPEDGNRYSLGISMNDVMSKLVDTVMNDPDPTKPSNEVPNERLSTEESPESCLLKDTGDTKESDGAGSEKTDNMAPMNKADDKKKDTTNRNRVFSLRRSFSESTLMLIKNRDVFMGEVTDEEIQENLRSLRVDLEKLFNESEAMISKCVGRYWNFLRKMDEESADNNGQSKVPMSESLKIIEDYTNAFRNEFKDYNNMIKRIMVSTYKIAKDSSRTEIQSLQRNINKKDIALNHFREENMRITHTMMDKEQDWALLKAKLYAEILNLNKETAKPWKELFSAGPKFGLVSLPWKRLKFLFEIYHNQEKMLSLVLDRDRKINELKLLIYQQQIMNCNLQEKLLLLNSPVPEPANVNSGDTAINWNEALKSELSRVSDVLDICSGSSVPYISSDPDEAIMEIFNLKGEDDLTSQDPYVDYFQNVDNCTDACSAPAVHDLMARFQDTTSE